MSELDDDDFPDELTPALMLLLQKHLPFYERIYQGKAFTTEQAQFVSNIKSGKITNDHERAFSCFLQHQHRDRGLRAIWCQAYGIDFELYEHGIDYDDCSETMVGVQPVEEIGVSGSGEPFGEILGDKDEIFERAAWQEAAEAESKRLFEHDENDEEEQ